MDGGERRGEPKVVVMYSTPGGVSRPTESKQGNPAPSDLKTSASIHGILSCVDNEPQLEDEASSSDSDDDTMSEEVEEEEEEEEESEPTEELVQPMPDGKRSNLDGAAVSEEADAASESESKSDLEDDVEDEELEDGGDEEEDDTMDEDQDEGESSEASWLQASRPSISRNREIVTSLPATVTRLETPEGSNVYLVGTAHFSLESQEDVAKTIQATQPDVVVMELCKGRVNILRMDEKTILEEAKVMNLEKVRSTIKQNGFVHGVMYLFLLSMSAHLTKQLGMAPGGEFRRAFAEAKKIPGCIVHLGDRPIQVTLQRALAELSLWQKLCLAWCMITSKDPISKEEVERYKDRDLLEEMLAEMTGKFPSISRVFVKERDVYLTHSLRLAASLIPCANSNSGAIPSVVVGVVGVGHVPGIVEHWGKVTEEDIPELLSIPESSLSSKILRYTFKAAVWGVVAWGCYRVVNRPSVVNVLSKIPSLKLKSS